MSVPIIGRTARRCVVPVVALALLAGLNACEGIKQSLGLSKQPPDEFAVVPNLPLVVPPDYNLRPPGTGGPGQLETPVHQKAARAVFGGEGGAPRQEAQSEVGFGQGEASILRAAGADRVDPNIRQVVDREFSIYAKDDESFVSDLMFWREDEPPGEPVDASAEARRLKENAALGRPVTEGETPTIRKRQRGFFEGIF
jgi:hypothetical protein